MSRDPWDWAPLMPTGPSSLMKGPSYPTSHTPGSHLQQLDYEDQWLRLLLQLIQILISQRVVSEHVGQATRVHVPLRGVLTLRHLPQAPGQDGVDPCVLWGKVGRWYQAVCSEPAGPQRAPLWAPPRAGPLPPTHTLVPWLLLLI